MGKIVMIIGGARSGKSTFAQQLAQSISNKVAFIATAEALDDEMIQRIDAHQKSRPVEWITIEATTGIGKNYINADIDVDVLIVDCLTLLISNLLMKAIDNDQVDTKLFDILIQNEFEILVETAQSSNGLWILVSNEVGLGIVPNDMISRVYRDNLGRVNQWVTAIADEVYYMAAGIPIPIHQFRR